MFLDGVRIVLVHTRFPENIGMASRACANMGCPDLCLVAPERWVYEKAVPLATPKGLPVLDAVSVHASLETAISDVHLVLGTTARTGGWRKGVLLPEEAAKHLVARLIAGEKVALLFGPEDRGLENSEIAFCQDLITIPTDAASSLNLAQSVLLVLYECAKAKRAFASLPKQTGKTVSQQEMQCFFEHFKTMLLMLDCLHGDNVEYFFLPWKRLFGRMELKRSEYDALMGLCRQIRNKIQTGIPSQRF
ncbi:MAG: RNA methyltransferase [Desulfovibrio sp.]|nr:RNA methyltransferase [Desulfovibrio sp.]